MNGSNPEISIVIPVYNSENSIEACIRSLLNQSFEEIEIICVDDASSDQSVDVIENLAKEDGRVILLRNESNQGTLIARKKGVLAAKGKYIMFSDNDDSYDSNACEIVHNETSKDNVDILMYSARPVFLDGSNETKLKYYNRVLTSIPESYEGTNCIKIRNRINLLWNKAVKAEICKKAYAGTEDIFLTVAEDTYASWMIHYWANTFRSIPNALYNWNIETGTSTEKKKDRVSFERYIKCMCDYEDALSRFLEQENENELLKEFEDGRYDRAKYCLGVWRRTIAEGDYVFGLEILFEHLGKERTINCIKSYLDDLVNRYDESVKRDSNNGIRIKKLKDENKCLREENKQLKQSTLSKIKKSAKNIFKQYGEN